MKTTLHRVVTPDKLRLDGLLFEPKQKSRRAVLHIHGMAGNFYENEFVDAMAQQYTAAGYAFLTGNTRGHDLIADFRIVGPKERYKRIGNSRERFEDCILDIKAWLKLLKRQGYTEIVLQGHSLGCSKVAYFLSKVAAPEVKALILASPSDMVGLGRVGKELKNYRRNSAIAKRMIAQGRGSEFLPKPVWGWYHLSARTYLNFTTEGGAIDVFSILNHKRASFKVLKNLRLPIFAFFGGGKAEEASILPKEQALKILKSKATAVLRFDYAVIGKASHCYIGYERALAGRVVRWLKSLKF